MAIKIRPIVSKDATSYRQCFDAVAKERRYLTDHEAPPLTEVRAQFRKILREEIPFLVAVDDGRVVGFALLEPWGPHSMSHTVNFGIGLLPEYREIGLGTKLLAGVLKLCRGKYSAVGLNVFRKNKRARNLYKKMGFKSCGQLKKAVKLAYGFDDLLYMQKQLGS